MTDTDYAPLAQELTRRARSGAAALRRASSSSKDAMLYRLAGLLDERRAPLLEANAKDLEAGRSSGLSGPLLDRLALDDRRIDGLIDAVRQIAELPDPVGQVDALRSRPSGIQVGRMRVPLGVILMVYESRPNVTVDAAALCLKAGNAVILRGGREATHSNQALASLVREALESADLPADGAILVDRPDRELLYALLGRAGEIDLAIPRGGTGLIDAVNAHAKVPVVQHYQGICHVYVHRGADLEMARDIAVNAKVQRPGVCNAMEGLLVDDSVADAFIPQVLDALGEHGVEVRGCPRTLEIAGDFRAHVTPASDADYDTEFLGLRCICKVVSGYDEAVAFIEAHGSGHTEAIVTDSHHVAMGFLRDVDASCVLINASTRFNDGGELGLGAELGISTTKLHAYGPMGLEELCAKKFVVLGHGETRS